MPVAIPKPPIENPKLRLTNSEAAMWRRCPRRWYLAYYRRLGTDDKNFNKPLGIGTRVHNALEIIYHPDKQDLDIIEVMKVAIEQDVQDHPVHEDAIRKEGDLAVIMIEGYLQWLEEEGKDQEIEIIEPEQGVEVPFLPDEGVTLLSKLDVRVRKQHDGSRWALEHKTVQSVTEPIGPGLQIDAQLLTEHLVEFMKLIEEGNEDQTADGVMYNMLRKVKRTKAAKPPFYAREEVRHNIHELRNHWRHMARVAREILAAREALDAGASHQDVCYPVPDNKTCSWQCPFLKVCPMMDDGSDYELALADFYVPVDPIERYNRELTTEEPDDTE